MYESYSKRDFDIFWSGCCDITKSSSFYHFLCYKCITLAILKHRHETHFIVCTKYGSKGISEKFTVLVKEQTKSSLRGGLYTEPPILMDSTLSPGILHWSPTRVQPESTRSLLRISSGLTRSPGGLHPDSTWSPSGIGRNTRSPPRPDFQSFLESGWAVCMDSTRTLQDIYLIYLRC